MNVEHRNGVIVIEQEDKLKVIRANGQLFPSDRWKPHKSYRDPNMLSTYDPKKSKK